MQIKLRKWRRKEEEKKSAATRVEKDVVGGQETSCVDLTDWTWRAFPSFFHRRTLEARHIRRIPLLVTQRGFFDIFSTRRITSNEWETSEKRAEHRVQRAVKFWCNFFARCKFKNYSMLLATNDRGRPSLHSKLTTKYHPISFHYPRYPLGKRTPKQWLLYLFYHSILLTGPTKIWFCCSQTSSRFPASFLRVF